MTSPRWSSPPVVRLRWRRWCAVTLTAAACAVGTHVASAQARSGALALALNADADWRPFKLEAYFFITLIYFVFCFAMSRYSLWVEKRTAVSKVR